MATAWLNVILHKRKIHSLVGVHYDCVQMEDLSQIVWKTAWKPENKPLETNKLSISIMLQNRLKAHPNCSV